MDKNKYVIAKATGDTETFSEKKLNHHLQNHGITGDLADSAIKNLESNINKIHSTDDIYHNISNYLKQQGATEQYFSYSLRRAVNQLGPTGHPFEYLVSEVLASQGYKTEVGVVALGKCVTHEIDVVAATNNDQYFIECKFHNSNGTKTDIQVALYTYARYLDVKFAMEKIHGTQTNYHSWLITNTKVTSEVFDYGECNNVKITAWYYPENEGLSDLIIKSKLHPVTILYNLSPKKINEIINRNIVTITSLKQAIKTHSVDDILTKTDIEQFKKDIKCLESDEPCD